MAIYKEVADQSVVEFDERYKRQVDAGSERRRDKKRAERDAYLEILKKQTPAKRN